MARYFYLFLSFLALSKGRTRRDLSLRRTGVCQSVRDGIVSRRTLAILCFIFPFFFSLFLESRVNDVRIYQRIDGFCGPTMFDPLTERERKKEKESHTLKSSERERLFGLTLVAVHCSWMLTKMKGKLYLLFFCILSRLLFSFF